MVSAMGLRVACLQFSPIHGRVQENLARADALLAARRADLEDPRRPLRLLVLPEMAFSGYHFSGGQHIDPLLEDSSSPSGLAASWCRRTAARLGCVVCCGLPTRARKRRRNSMLVVGPDGEVLDTYDKHFLYVSDRTWAEPGEGFRSLDALPGIPLRPIGLGICMDINPQDFKAPRDAFEFAMYHKEAGSRLIVFCSAWCTNHPDDPPEAFQSPLPDAYVFNETVRYWLKRLSPLAGQDVFFVCADRVGEEDLSLLGPRGASAAAAAGGSAGAEALEGTVRSTRNRFCGCSCVLSLSDGRTLGALGATEEGVLVVDIPVDQDEERPADRDAQAAPEPRAGALRGSAGSRRQVQGRGGRAFRSEADEG
mmetsp:Transcript_102673/g.329059  ORF Transcript_102673/g.329059 Transcript_102673/m.329059 type:complete len:367 (-) Transcript_102673:2-1102(-)